MYWRIVLYLDLDNRKIIRKVNANKRCGWNRKKSFDPFHGSCLLLSQQWEQGCLQNEDISFFSCFFFLLLLLLFSALIRYLWAWDIPNRYQHMSVAVLGEQSRNEARDGRVFHHATLSMPSQGWWTKRNGYFLLWVKQEQYVESWQTTVLTNCSAIRWKLNGNATVDHLFAITCAYNGSWEAVWCYLLLVVVWPLVWIGALSLGI